MPFLASLLFGGLSALYRVLLAMFGVKWAIRLTAATTIAGLYVACAVTFSLMIVPWFTMWYASHVWLGLLGLLFPSVAGTVIASLGTLWACILAKRHTVKLIKMTVKGE